MYAVRLAFLLSTGDAFSNENGKWAVKVFVNYNYNENSLETMTK